MSLNDIEKSADTLFSTTSAGSLKVELEDQAAVFRMSKLL